MEMNAWMVHLLGPVPSMKYLSCVLELYEVDDSYSSEYC